MKNIAKGIQQGNIQLDAINEDLITKFEEETGINIIYLLNINNMIVNYILLRIKT